MRRSSAHRPILDYADVDRALEYAEDRMLDESRVDLQGCEMVPLREQPLCSNFDNRELELLRSLLKEEYFEAGTVICEEGQPADKLYFLASGRVSASVKLDHKRRRRLSASAAGWAFGESALVHGHRRTADIIADTAVTLYSLQPDAFGYMDDPGATAIMVKLLRNLADVTLDRLGRANREIRTLTT